MPPESYFSKVFGKSPISPLQQHMHAVLACVSVLPDFFSAVCQGNWDEASRQQQQIAGLERDADRLKKQLRQSLPKGRLFLAVGRRDLLEVLTMQDKVANKAKDIAGLVIGRRLAVPPSLQDALLEFVNRAVETVAQAQRAVDELDELLDTGFRGREVELVERMLERLDQLESEADRFEVVLRSGLFAIERELWPVDVIFLYRVIDWIGEMADRAQRVGSRLQIALAQ